jgi:hypothetical protein
MKSSAINIDIIGGLGSLTKEEEKALSEYFKNKKSLFRTDSSKAKIQGLNKPKSTARMTNHKA